MVMWMELTGLNDSQTGGFFEEAIEERKSLAGFHKGFKFGGELFAERWDVFGVESEVVDSKKGGLIFAKSQRH